MAYLLARQWTVPRASANRPSWFLHSNKVRALRTITGVAPTRRGAPPKTAQAIHGDARRCWSSRNNGPVWKPDTAWRGTRIPSSCGSEGTAKRSQPAGRTAQLIVAFFGFHHRGLFRDRFLGLRFGVLLYHHDIGSRFRLIVGDDNQIGRASCRERV